jgi:ADP-ribose pyrophosphatase YjhB (NUDIX family)
MPYLSNEDFFSVYSKVPRLNVDLVIRSPQGVLLALRTIEPWKGYWHLPGGTVYKTERIADAAVRIAKKETGLAIMPGTCLGYMEFPHEVRSGNAIHTVSVVIEASPTDNNLQPDENAEKLQYFAVLPTEILKEHGDFLRNTLSMQ